MSNPIKPTFKTEWWSVIMIVLAFLAGAHFYSRFPAQVPTHWNFQGQVNGYSSPLLAAFLLPAMMLVLYLVFLLLPYIDPKKDQYAAFASAYHHFKDLIVGFLFVLFILIGLNGLGYQINIGFWAPVLVGLLFIIIGALLNKIKMNWFLGIRTPWTLSSETVWAKTHQLSSRVLMLAGVLIALTAFLPSPARSVLFIAALALIIFALPIYSYFLYAKEKKEKNNPKI